MRFGIRSERNPLLPRRPWEWALGGGRAIADTVHDRDAKRVVTAYRAAFSLLAAANAGLLVATLFSTSGASLGPLDGGRIATAVLVADLVGVGILAAAFLRPGDVGFRGERRFRSAGQILAAWIAASAFWRFGIPFLAGTDLEALFWDVTTPDEVVDPLVHPGVVGSLLSVWVLAALLFLLAHVQAFRARRVAFEDAPARDLPALALLVGAGISFLGTCLIAAALLPALRSGSLSGLFLPGAVLKVLVAPNLLAAAYLRGAELAWDRAKEGAKGPAPTDA